MNDFPPEETSYFTFCTSSVISWLMSCAKPMNFRTQVMKFSSKVVINSSKGGDGYSTFKRIDESTWKNV